MDIGLLRLLPLLKMHKFVFLYDDYYVTW